VNPAGIVIAVAGVWVIAQVFAGNALERLAILKPAGDAAGGGGGAVAGAVGGAITGALPGGASNPAYPNLRDLIPGLGTGYGRGL
jgi:hypothetical protein